eukprot:TRINITY_DN3397_c0_g1_i1.p1 TRINITY_DN3397_c0_g1~~TRINITY_DN3397_c0_g1_i1.p1  ORF type:complete len:345 (+),score=71.76 TRINITY_DN3397_c0_g1_i1:466-1500(+)
MEQHDSAEFITYLFGWMDDEIKDTRVKRKDPREGGGEEGKVVSPLTAGDGGLLLSRTIGLVHPSTQSIRDIIGTTNQKPTNGKQKAIPKNSIFQLNPFCGLLESTVRCNICGFTSTTYNEFLELTIPIHWYGRTSRSLSLSDCFEKFTESETVTWKCEECSHAHEDAQWQTTAKKQLTIARHPKLLLVHLQRLVQGGKVEVEVKFGPGFETLRFSSFEKGIFSPAYRAVSVTEDLLNVVPDLRPLDPLASPRTAPPGCALPREPLEMPTGSSIEYDLVAIICHYGSAYGGHYVVFKRVLQAKQEGRSLSSEWVFMSDDKWKMVSEEAVFQQQKYATLLFYQKMD